MTTKSGLVLGIFYDRRKALEILPRLHANGFSSCVAISRDANGKIREDEGSALSRRGATLGSAMGLLLGGALPVVALPRAARLMLAGAGASLGATAGNLAWHCISPSVPEKIRARYRSRVMPGETLVLVQAPTVQFEKIIALLRADDDNPPATFVLRPNPVAGESSRTAVREEARREPLIADQLREHAIAVAKRHADLPEAARAFPLLNRLRENGRVIDAVCDGLAEAARLEQPVSLSAEWLLDNAYIIGGQIADTQRNLSRSFYAELPVLAARTNGAGAGQKTSVPRWGTTRVYSIAYDLIAHSDNRLDADNIREYLAAYQSVTPLTMGELWALPLMLRLALIESLRRLVVQVDRRQRDRERAEFWSNRLLAAARRSNRSTDGSGHDADQLLALLGELSLEQARLHPHFADRLISHLYDEESVLVPVRSWVERKMAAPLTEVIQREQRRQAVDQVTFSNTISSLRFLSQLDWREVFERTSLVNNVLLNDPAEVYGRMNFATRDAYRHQVERIAWGLVEPRKSATQPIEQRQRAGLEIDVAGAAIDLAAQSRENAQSAGEPTSHVGYYLSRDGVRTLEEKLAYRPPAKQQIRRWILDHPEAVYFGGLALGTVATLAGAGGLARRSGARGLGVLALPALLPATEIAVQAVNFAVTHILPPHRLPKMSFEASGIPDEYRTLVVVPMLLLSEKDIDDDVEKLEIRYLANPDPNLRFALLADYVDAPEATMPADAGLLQRAINGIDDLNARHGGRGRFFLFHRERRWSETESKWMGWERKRGKLEELNRYLIERAETPPTALHPVAGDPAMLDGIRFVITLDADTQLPHDTARAMIETLAHPLNRPRFAANEQDSAGFPALPVGGYGIIQPRVTTALPSATATNFSRIFTDARGTDPYTQVVSDVYQDLFGEGSYHGKGIYDLQTFHKVLDGRFPDTTLLSHDLIEGAHVRVGLASDIELFDQFPSNYLSYSKREHRWIRGDWQIADWIAPAVPSPRGRVANPLSLFNRWKVGDNLRRSLARPLIVTTLLAGWLGSPATAIAATALVGGLLALPLPMQLLGWLPSRNGGLRTLGSEMRQTAARVLLATALLPHQAGLSLDATCRTLWRKWKTERNLLEWETAQVSYQSAAERQKHFLRRLWGSSFFALATNGAIFALNSAALPYAAPILALWTAAPLLVAWLNKTPPVSAEQDLALEDIDYLHRVARQTWRYFDDFVGPQTNWLPPDNYQESLRIEIAQRTSPTNIGLWLLSLLSAHDFGYLPLDELLGRASATMETLGELERHRGHLLNWYNVQTLEPLPPRYVSTVDSGNLLGALWTLQQGIRDLVDEPVIDKRVLNGLRDTLNLLAEAIEQEKKSLDAPALQNLRALLEEPVRSPLDVVRRLRSAVELSQELLLALGEASRQADINTTTLQLSSRAARDNADWHATTSDPRFAATASFYWAVQIEQQLGSWTQQVNRYLKWLERLDAAPSTILRELTTEAHALRVNLLEDPPSLEALARGEVFDFDRFVAACGAPEADSEFGRWLDELVDEFGRSRWLAGEMLATVESLLDTARRMGDELELRFLYDEKRKLFSIGFNVEEGRLDASYYDLLASECRLASFLAIARTEVPLEHWMSLGRRFGGCNGRTALMSWSGTMFEYLMPLLLMRPYEKSLLDDACRTAVLCQIDYGRQGGVPWGISEAAFSALDAQRTYQYRAFGVPSLGLKRGLEDDLVVAPYATMLALPLFPKRAVANLRALEQIKLRGDYGFYESIDYSRTRLRDDDPETPDRAERGVLVRCYMVHHQGMSLIAINNLLNKSIMQERFHADPAVRASELLLHERVPASRTVVEELVSERPPLRLRLNTAGTEPSERFASPDLPLPRVHLLANENYSLMITAAGGGYSRWRDFEITRWRADSTRDCWGSFCYIRDLESNVSWSTSHQPLRRAARHAGVNLAAEKAEFRRRDAEIETITDVVVSPEDDAEVRRITLVNHSSRARRLEVTSYAELSLAPHAADRAHPAFAKLFVQTEADEELGALLAWRRPRKPDDPAIWAGHILTVSPNLKQQAAHSPETGATPAFQYETDRSRFLGRGRTVENPRALEGPLSNTAGAVLDPVFSLRQGLTLEPGQRVELSFVTAAGDAREKVRRILQKYSELASTHRTLDVAWTQAQLEMHHLRIHPDDANRFQQLASFLIYPFAALRAPAKRIRDNRKGQSGLWAYGISGDLPIMVVTIDDVRDINTVREALQAHTFWRIHGFKADLVVLNEQAGGYNQDLTEQLSNLIISASQHTGTNQPGGVFLRAADTMPPEDVNLLLAVARVVMVAARGNLAQQLSSIGSLPVPPPRLVVTQRPAEEPSAKLPFLELPYFNGLGGFTEDGREYAIYLGNGTSSKAGGALAPHSSTTPAPWSNIIANPEFGTLVTESGLGFSWFGNSQSNRLTPWSNDPISDPSDTCIYIRDEESGIFWSPTPSPIRENDAYRARHGQGYTQWEHNSHAIEQLLTTFVPLAHSTTVPAAETVEGGKEADSEDAAEANSIVAPAAIMTEHEPVLIHQLRLVNRSSRRRRLTVTFYADWVLGTTKEETQPHVVTHWDTDKKILLAENAYHPDFGSRVAFAASQPVARSFTADRTSFLGRNGSPANPASLRRRHLSDRAGVAYDACAALQVAVELNPNEETTVNFLLGQADDIAGARALVEQFRNVRTTAGALVAARSYWDELLGTLQVDTPILAVDMLLNRWLIYQTLSCRIWGRSAFYQSGGAFGFRDQLQDVMAMVYSAPHVTREQIVRAAAHQFEEGDVQHWWHPPSGAGVRTLISDDLLFLPYVTAHYVRVTGDQTVLDELAPFLHADPLGEGEHEKYFQPETSQAVESIFEHCRRAIEKGCTKGPHDLPLMGAGDWNDGMNRVGIEGKGESVWLAWFAIDVLNAWAEVCTLRGETEMAKDCRKRARAYAKAVEKAAWDGEWYLRAFFDDGSPLGSHVCEEGRIDALPQAWSVLSGAGDAERSEIALQSMEKELVYREEKMIKLFTPPFDDGPQNPGYIKGYLPGVRENGGQYTHAAVWAAMSYARAGQGTKAVELLSMLNPIEHAREPQDVEKYKVEPYVVAADIYDLEGQVGRGGWTWYTGSASWMYRAWIEEVLGFKLRADKLVIDPVIPTDWKEFTIRYRYKNTPFIIRVENPDGVERGVAAITVDGKALRSESIPLKDDGVEHRVVVRLGADGKSAAPRNGRTKVVVAASAKSKDSENSSRDDSEVVSNGSKELAAE